MPVATSPVQLRFDERFEVAESLFEALGIDALHDERISDLAEHAARQRVVEGRGQRCSIAFGGELPASAPRQLMLLPLGAAGAILLWARRTYPTDVATALAAEGQR